MFIRTTGVTVMVDAAEVAAGTALTALTRAGARSLHLETTAVVVVGTGVALVTGFVEVAGAAVVEVLTSGTRLFTVGRRRHFKTVVLVGVGATTTAVEVGATTGFVVEGATVVVGATTGFIVVVVTGSMPMLVKSVPSPSTGSRLFTSSPIGVANVTCAADATTAANMSRRTEENFMVCVLVCATVFASERA